MKRFFYLFGWTVIIGLIVYFGAKFQFYFRHKASETFVVLPVILYSFIFLISIGILLRLPKLIIEMRQNKPWTFDWIKFIAIGVPSLCVSLIYVLMYYLPEGISPFIPQIIFLGNPFIQTIASVVFGYVLLDCLKK